MQPKSSLAQHLSSSHYVLCLIGAGLSAPSGIPTFEDDERLGYDPKRLATKAAFNLDPASVWVYYNHRRHKALHAEPNSGHYALAELARWKPTSLTITQNIDGLSQRAGHDSTRLVEIHGSLFRARCESCGWTQPNVAHESCVASLPVERRSIDTDMAASHSDFAHCPNCATGKLRPGVVGFGEQIPLDQLARIDQWLSLVPRIDLMLVIGTAARVFPAAEYIHHAREKGAFVAHFNYERDDDHMEPGDWFVPGNAADTLPRIVAEAME